MRRFPPCHGGPTLSSAPCIFAENQLASCRLACHASVCLPSCAWLFETPWSVATQAPLSMEFSRQEHCSGLPCPPPGNLPNRGFELKSPALQVDSLPTEPPGKPTYYINICQILRHLRDIFSRIVAAKVISGGDDWNLVCNINYWKDFVM